MAAASSMGRRLKQRYNLCNIGSNGHYELSGNCSITETITVKKGDVLEIIGVLGPNGAKPAIDGGWDGSSGSTTGVRLFEIQQGGALNVDNMILKHGPWFFGQRRNQCNVVISGNTASLYNGGGGFYITGGVINVTNSVISGNTASYGGGFYIKGGVINVMNSVISGNTAGSASNYACRGGGFYITGGVINVMNSVISGNTARQSGGGFYITGGVINVMNSVISGNTAFYNDGYTYRGGGFYITGGVINVTNSVISGIRDGGGGFYIAVINVTNSVISGNPDAYIDPNFYNVEANFIHLKEVSFTKASDKLYGFTTSNGCKSPSGCLLGDGGVVVLFESTKCKPLNAEVVHLPCTGATSHSHALRAKQADTILNANRSACIVCPDGTYSTETGLQTVSQCKSCTPGSSCTEGQMQSCAKGSYSNVPNLAKCIVCPGGQYQSSTGKQFCLPCDLGTYLPNSADPSEHANKDQCISCPAGKYGISTSSATCELCNLGRWSAKVGAISSETCQLCPNNTINTSSGSKECA